jgi:hypothetical protein
MTRISWIFHLSNGSDEEKWCGVVVVVFRGVGTKVKQSKQLLLHIGANKN